MDWSVFYRKALKARRGWIRLVLGCAMVLGVWPCCPQRAAAQDTPSDTVECKLKTKVVPEYPSVARQLRLQGKVKVEARISADGHVTNTDVLGGHPTLAAAAEEAIKKWRFEPGPKDTKEIIEIVFTRSD